MNASLQDPDLLLGERIIVPKQIAAIRISAKTDGPKLGLILQLPADNEVQVCGPGFNEKTIRVFTQNAYYFVFLEDVQNGRRLVAAAAAN